MRRRRRVSSLSQPRLVAATQSCRVLWRAKKSIKHFSAVPLPRGNPGQPGANNGQVASCVYQMLISFSVFFLFFFLCFFFFYPTKGESSSGALSFSMPSNPCLLYRALSYKSCSSPRCTLSRPWDLRLSQTERGRERKGEGETIALSCQVSALTLKE